MKIKTSPLQLKNFQVLQLDFKCVFPSAENVMPPSKRFEKYLIDVDFIWKKQKDGAWIVMCKLDINREQKPLPGYSILIEGISFFKLPPSIDKKEQDNLLKYSATGIAIQCLRDSVKNITAQAPFGKLIVPTFDLNYLVNEKISQMAQKKK